MALACAILQVTFITGPMEYVIRGAQPMPVGIVMLLQDHVCSQLVAIVRLLTDSEKLQEAILTGIA